MEVFKEAISGGLQTICNLPQRPTTISLAIWKYFEVFRGIQNQFRSECSLESQKIWWTFLVSTLNLRLGENSVVRDS